MRPSERILLRYHPLAISHSQQCDAPLVGVRSRRNPSVSARLAGTVGLRVYLVWRVSIIAVVRMFV